MEIILEKINKASLKFLESLTLSETYATIVEEGRKIIGVEYASIFLEKNGILDRVYGSSPFLYKLGNPEKGGLVYKSFLTASPYFLSRENLISINPKFKKTDIYSSTVIPLSYKGKTIGVMTYLSSHAKKFADKDLEILKLFGSMASLAIQKANNYSNMEKAFKERDQHINLENVLQKINKASLKFLEPLDLKETYAIIVKEAIKLVDANYGSLALEEEGEFKDVYSTLPIKVKQRKNGFKYKAFKESKVLVIYNKESEKFKKAHPEFNKTNIKSILLIPLSYKRKSIGVLIVNSEKKEYFTKKELGILLLFGSFASLAIKNVQFYTEMKQAVEIRNIFMSMAAHEFRTPLTTISGYVQLLNSKLSSSDSQQAKWVKELLWESNRLTSLVNELLEVNRIKAGQFEYNWSECSLKSVIQTAMNNLSFSYPNRKIEFKNKLNKKQDLVIGDFNKLLQVLINILENAAKFSLENTKIVITLMYKYPDLVIRVKDYGKGIEEKDKSMIFHEFYKANKETDEGMGLGLFLAKTIIKQHHGDISFKSKVNKGTTVELKLPKAKL